MSTKVTLESLKALLATGAVDPSILGALKAVVEGRVQTAISVLPPAKKVDGKGYWPAKIAVSIPGKKAAWIPQEVAQHIVESIDEMKYAIEECARLDRELAE